MEPGIYHGISNKDYHKGKGISKSQLDYIAECPALYQWHKSAPVDEEKIKALDIGTAFHCLVLEPEEFEKRFIVSPVFNRRTKEGKEEEAAFINSMKKGEKIIIDEEDKRKLLLMRDSALAHPLAKWLIEVDGIAESSIFWVDEETGIECRIRPDKVIKQHNWIVDVKTTADMSRFKYTFYDYRYHVQDAFYSDGYQACFGEQPTFVFLVVSTSVNCGRYPVNVFILDEQAKEAGRNTYKANLQTFAECLKENEFPSIQTLSLPKWATELKNV